MEMPALERVLLAFQHKEADRAPIYAEARNVGFIESGHMEKEEYESTDEALQELYEDLKEYYLNGPQYVSRIVCNERM